MEQHWMLQHRASGEKGSRRHFLTYGSSTLAPDLISKLPCKQCTGDKNRRRSASMSNVSEKWSMLPSPPESCHPQAEWTKQQLCSTSGWPRCSARRGASSTAGQWDSSDAIWTLPCCDVPSFASGYPGHLNTTQQLSSLTFNSLKGQLHWETNDNIHTLPTLPYPLQPGFALHI